MTSKLQGYSTIGTNNKEAAEIFYDGLLAQINAKSFLLMIELLCGFLKMAIQLF